MNLEKEYRNVDGEPRNILQLVKEEPGWAANVIQYYEDRVAQMEAEGKRLREENECLKANISKSSLDLEAENFRLRKERDELADDRQ